MKSYSIAVSRAGQIKSGAGKGRASERERERERERETDAYGEKEITGERAVLPSIEDISRTAWPRQSIAAVRYLEPGEHPRARPHLLRRVLPSAHNHRQ